MGELPAAQEVFLIRYDKIYFKDENISIEWHGNLKYYSIFTSKYYISAWDYPKDILILRRGDYCFPADMTSIKDFDFNLSHISSYDEGNDTILSTSDERINNFIENLLLFG